MAPDPPPRRSPEATDAVSLERWEGCTAAELAAAWALPAVHLFESVGSTNDAARELAAAGTPAGTLVLAEEQRTGRGRAGRGWSSPSGLGLWFSLLLRPDPPAPSAIPLHVGVRLAAALDRWAGAESIALKWPNDLLVGGRKLGGILCEAFWDAGRLDHMVVGVGLNLLQEPGDFPPELAASATSLRWATREPISRFEVAGAVVAALLPLVRGEMSDPEALASAIAGRDALRGRRIEVFDPDTGRVQLIGRAAGVSGEGALLVMAERGVREVRSGSVRFADEGS